VGMAAKLLQIAESGSPKSREIAAESGISLSSIALLLLTTYRCDISGSHFATLSGVVGFYFLEVEPENPKFVVI
jgi:hypothetical protein